MLSMDEKNWKIIYLDVDSEECLAIWLLKEELAFMLTFS